MWIAAPARRPYNGRIVAIATSISAGMKLFRQSATARVFAVVLVYALFLTQGLPLWDDDFTSWFATIQGQNIWSLILECLSPLSTQPQHWGFNERPIQKLVYKVLHSMAEYQGWAYFLFKDLVYAGAGAMVYLWSLRLVPATRAGRWAALAATALFVLAPGPAASLVLYADFAPLAELVFLAVTYAMWSEFESTPAEWRGLPHLSNVAHRRWLLRWCGLSVAAYLGYKCKADLKLIPVILAGYVALVRPKQWGFFAVPLALMGLLAVPWGRGALGKLPPFLPGSQGSQVAWMFQPASLERLLEFFWSGQGYDALTTLREPTLSLAAVLGPFLLVPLLLFLIWRMESFDRVPWLRLETPVDRARLFALIWFSAIVVAISSLAAINYTFRIRYGILPLVPLSLLLAWTMGLVAESWGVRGDIRPLPRHAALILVVMLLIQCGINLQRSMRYRHDLGQVMVAVDQAYDFLDKRPPGERLALLPDFRPYDYKSDSHALIREKQVLSDGKELVSKGFPVNKTWVLSWKPSLWERLEVVEHYTGCRPGVLIDLLYPCTGASGVWVMRFISADVDYAQGETLRAQGDLSGARKLHEAFLSRHPASPAGYFVVGLESYELKDYVRAEQVYSWLEAAFPDHLSILYNHALALEGLGRLREAMPRLEAIVARESRNYGALLHLYWAYRKDGQADRAREVLLRLRREFPDDAEVKRLASGSP